jgi:myosin-5
VVSKIVELENVRIIFADGLGNTVENSFTSDTEIEINSIKLRNDPAESSVENLINLPYLHEPAILHCLQQRYINGDIYTYTGPILIALNPFKRLSLYTDNILETYYNSGLLKSQGIENAVSLPPHVFAIADAAYRDM